MSNKKSCVDTWSPQCRCLEHLLVPQGEMGLSTPEKLLCCQSLLQGLIFPFCPGRPSEMLPCEPGQARRGPLGQKTKDILQSYLHSLFPLLCFDCEIPLSLGMNQFSHPVAMAGFCHLSVPTQLGVRGQTQHEGRGAAQQWGLDLAAIPP